MRLERVFTYRLIRLLRVGIPVLVAGLIAVPLSNYLSRRARQGGASPNVQPLEDGLAVRTEDFTFARTLGDRTLFTIRAKNNLGYKDNRNALENVEVTVYGATGNEPPRRIRSKYCSYDQETGDIRFEGDVEAQLDERTTARGAELTYNNGTRLVASSQKTFLDQPGAMKGHADRLEYALDSGVLELDGGVEVETSGGAILQSDSAQFHQKENWATMNGGVFVKARTGSIRGASARAALEPGTYKPRRITIEANVMGESQQWKFRAGWLQATISAASNVERLEARGGVELDEIGGDHRRLTGGEIDATLGADGKVEILEARQNAQMNLGADRTLSSSQIWSNAAGSVETMDDSLLRMGGATIQGRQFTIQQGEIISFNTPMPATLKSGGRESSAGQTRARFDSRTNTLVELVQTGNFRFKDARYEGSSASARFEEGGTIVTLDGSPVVTDAEKKLEGDRIRLNQKDNSFVAAGKVRTLMKSPAEPVLVKAARAEGGADSILYTGSVELWRGIAYIKAELLRATARGETNSLHAERKVQSNFNNIRTTSDVLDIDEARGVARYTGAVRAQKQDMILETPDMTVTLHDNTVREIAASGGVVVTRADQRGIGDRAVYEAAGENVILTGNPAKVRDGAGRTVEGARLTMKTTGETAVVEGGRRGRTVTTHPITK